MSTITLGESLANFEGDATGDQRFKLSDYSGTIPGFVFLSTRQYAWLH